MRLRELVILALGLLSATDAGIGNVDKELPRFQGNWILIAAEREGKITPPEEAKQIKLSVMGNKFTLKKDGVLISEGSFTLNPDKKPKEIDEMVTSGPNKGKIFLAIYELKDDEQKICFAAAGKARPTAFSAAAGSGQLLQVWKRSN